MRKTEFAIGEYYHIYNRGVDKRDVFLDNKDYLRFLTSVREFNQKEAIGSLYEKYLRDKKANHKNGGSTSIMEVEPPFLSQKLVEIICYCFNPNHYHFILRQLQEKGVEMFMHRLGTSYTMYFNKKNNRSGSLFQGRYKSIHIDSNEYLLHLSVYVNSNHTIHNYKEKEWSYSSYLDYTGKRYGKLCAKGAILGQFDNNPLEYEKFMQNNINYFREKKELEKYVLE